MRSPALLATIVALVSCACDRGGTPNPSARLLDAPRIVALVIASAPAASAATSSTKLDVTVATDVASAKPLDTSESVVPRSDQAAADDAARSLLVWIAASGRAAPTAPPLEQDDPISGASDARVAAIVFGDFACPFTAEAVKTPRSLQASYGHSVLRLAWKHRPLDFHRRARPASRAAQSVFLLAGGEAFWKFVDEAARDPSSRQAGAAEAGAAWLARAGTAQLDAKIDADLQVAEEYAVRSVPVVWIADQRFEGAQSRQVYAMAIDDALSGVSQR